MYKINSAANLFKVFIRPVVFTLFVFQFRIQAQNYHFTTENTLNITPNATDIGVADFIGGERKEIIVSHATTYGGPGSVSLFQYRASNSAWGLVNSIQTSLSPLALAAGDFDGDGFSDFALTHHCNCDDHTIFGGDGNGNFTNVLNGFPFFSGSAKSFDGTVGDISNDNKPDFITGGSSTLNIFRNYSSGATDFYFINMPESIADPSNNTGGVALGDFNGDNWNDIVVGKPGSSSVLIFWNTGFGTFMNSSVYPVVNNVIESMMGVAVGDFNGDNKPDIVATDNSGGKICVLLNGASGFNVSANYSAGSSPTYPEVADMNGDGKADIVVAHEHGFSIFTNNGNGSFGTPYLHKSAEKVKRIALNDFNNDGNMDVVYITDINLVVLLNNKSTTGIENSISKSSLKLFPIPVKDYLNISYMNEFVFDIEIYNALGELVFKKDKFNDNRINIGDWAAGVYSLWLINKNNGEIETIKFVKE